MKGADRHTVLIVDDDDLMRAYLRTMLRAAGFREVGEAGDVARARKALAQRPASVVFLDINLPGEDGLTALKTLRNDYPDTAFIMLSGDSTASNVQTALADGARGFVAKPFAAENVYRSIGRALRLPAD
jgi:DNA-binding NarL/FixJ family response regulator